VFTAQTETENNMSQDSLGQATSTQPAIEQNSPVAGQGDACSRNGGHNDSSHPNIDPRTSEEKAAAADANRVAQAKHSLGDVKQCAPVEGQANPDGHLTGNPSETALSSDDLRRRHHAQPLNCTLAKE
jgi:hypothetical protein